MTARSDEMLRRDEWGREVNTHQQSVLAFHQKYNCLWEDTPKMPDLKTLLLRVRLIVEEAGEFAKAASQTDMVEMADALADLLYVTYGAAVVLGVDIEPIFAEVQRSNMTKDGGGHDSAGKVRKGPDFTPPDIASKLREQGWNG